MPIKINVEQILKGIALIEKGTQSPLVKAAIEKILPDLGVSPEDMATLASHHADYLRWLADAEKAAGK